MGQLELACADASEINVKSSNKAVTSCLLCLNVPKYSPQRAYSIVTLLQRWTNAQKPLREIWAILAADCTGEEPVIS